MAKRKRAPRARRDDAETVELDEGDEAPPITDSTQPPFQDLPEYEFDADGNIVPEETYRDEEPKVADCGPDWATEGATPPDVETPPTEEA